MAACGIYNPKYEVMPSEELKELQLRRLQDTVMKVYYRVPFYRRMMEKVKTTPDDIKSLDDIRRLPFTTKTDLRDNYPFGLFAVPDNEIVRIHASSGTTGKPTVVGYTQKDIDTWRELIARIVTAAGVTNSDTVQIAFGYGLFTGGFGLHYGCEHVGASVIPASSGNTERQLMLMQDFKVTALVCTPTYALHIAEIGEEKGIDFKKLPLRWGLFGGEPWSQSMREQIEKRLNITATDNYGLSEIIGPGVSGECLEQNGLHIAEDHFLAEIVDPDTFEPVHEGEKGELVFTSLTKEAIPVLRYRTRDITCFMSGECPCGRTLKRMERVSGRNDDMLIIRGVNVFPSQIESVLLEIEGAEPHYTLIVDRKGTLDTLEVKVEVSEEMFKDEMKQMEAMEAKVATRIQSVLGISAKVTLVEPKTIERFMGKAKRVIDRRNR
ncbi:MAG: phenylacetate--CoA ligase [Candidatus Latescibacteria bacterium]|nr:phenylacetate--CoA ligase [Candidatus Latescibacterota bacterium]